MQAVRNVGVTSEPKFTARMIKLPKVGCIKGDAIENVIESTEKGIRGTLITYVEKVMQKKENIREIGGSIGRGGYGDTWSNSNEFEEAISVLKKLFLPKADADKIAEKVSEAQSTSGGVIDILS